MARTLEDVSRACKALIYRARRLSPEDRKRVAEMLKKQENLLSNGSQTIDQCFQNLVQFGLTLPMPSH